MNGLSVRQKQLYDFIDGFVRENGYAPSIKDIAEGVGIGNSTAAAHLNAMRKKHRVTWRERTPRSLRVIP
jgi:repressor LexA